MYRIILGGLCVLMFIGCKRHVGTGDHLPAKEMQKILLDVSIAETYSIDMKDAAHRGNIKNTDSLSAFYKTIFSHYNITEEEFRNSMEWYKNHPEELDTLYARMLPVATRWSANTPPPPPPVRPVTPGPVNMDSLMRNKANAAANKPDSSTKRRPGTVKPTVK